MTRVALFRPARTLAGMLMTAGVALVASGSPVDAAGRMPPRTVEFSGYTWQVKASAAPIGPGPNYFADSADNVWVDGRGRLHLKVTYSNGRWYSAEVINTRSLGRGRYTFKLGSHVNDLDPNVVLGLFTWSGESAYNNREIDIEFSRWAKARTQANGQFVVQPYGRSTNRTKVRQPAVALSTHSFDWRRKAVRFASSSATPSAWTYVGPDVPEPGSEHVHMNLWLYRGAHPKNGRTAEVIVSGFRFQALASGRR